jgi:hypothetical protein
MITAIHLLRQLEIGNPAERNNVFASYAIPQATGRLSVKQLGLAGQIRAGRTLQRGQGN